MKTKEINLCEITTTVLFVGFEGEQNYRRFVIDASEVFADMPDAVPGMAIKPPVGNVYPKSVQRNGNKVIWEVSASDCAHEGDGEYQLTFTNGNEIGKVFKGQFRVFDSLIGSGKTPDPIEDFVEDANAVLGELRDMTASASGLPAGSAPTAEITDVGGHKNIAFGIPAGEPGENGEPGEDGVSPIITVTDITGGHRVTIIDAEGTHTFDVLDGKDGKNGTDGTDGYSPTVTVTEITNGHRVTITDAFGAHTFDVMDGQGGTGSSDYTDLSNKPQIGGVTLVGNKSLHDIGAAAESAIPVLTDLIDDTTTTATNKVWSAKKSSDENLLLSGAIGVGQPTAQESDVGKFLKLKTIDSNGKPTAFEYGEGGSGGTSDYSDLTNKPQINGNTLSGNKTGASIGLLDAPSTAGTSGQVLTSNGNGGQVWANVGSGSIVVDNTLSVAGAAADAKATGNVKSELNNITGISEVPLTTGAYVYTAGTVGTTVIDFSTAIKSNANYAYAIVNASEGDVFCINAVGSGNAFLWTFVNSSNVIIDRSAQNATGSNTLVTAPANASKLIINSTVAGMGFCSKGKPINTRISDIDLTSNGKPHRMIAGVIRNSGSGWDFIVDSNHQGDLNCVSVGIANDGRLYVDYSSLNVKKVISAIFAPDEAFANAGYIMGASVGKTASYIQIFQYGFNSVSANIKFANGDNGVEITVDDSDGVSAAVWDDTTKTLNITHENIVTKVNSSAPTVTFVPTVYGKYLMRLYSYGGTNTRIEFLNPTTMQKVTTLDTNMSFSFSRIGSALQRNEIDPSTLVSANGNIWFMGIFEV